MQTKTTTTWFLVIEQAVAITVVEMAVLECEPATTMKADMENHTSVLVPVAVVLLLLQLV